MRLRVALICAAFLAGPVWAAEPAPADPAKAQQIVTTVCAACHGADGNSAIPANPNLAQQIPEYTTKQLANFKSGDRVNAVMAGMVAALTPEDMTNLGAYFSQQAAKPGTATSKEQALLGQSLYRGGNAATGVPACSGCHSPNGVGIPRQYPRLAGQHAEYIAAQLKAFRTDERANDPNKMMRMIAAKMSDREIEAVSQFIQGLR
ncbi:MAG TPA: c-type cytochrome [Burkholderiales bacterium]|nr:c-type cytochrome [Burkholderiales bacterium]